jgi:hypothetical protein
MEMNLRVVWKAEEFAEQLFASHVELVGLLLLRSENLKFRKKSPPILNNWQLQEYLITDFSTLNIISLLIEMQMVTATPA